MTTGLKIGIGTALSASVIGGAVGVSYALPKPQNLSIRQELEKAGIIILDTKIGSENSDDTSWGTLATEHAKTQVTKNIPKINGLNIEVHSNTGTANLGINHLKIRCDNLLARNSKSKGYEQAKIDAKNWCSKSSPLLNS